MKSLAVSDRYGWSRYVAHQAYYSLIGRDYEWELMPLGLDQGVGAVVWSPLGWGRLTGKIRRGQPLPKVSRLHADRRHRAAGRLTSISIEVVDALDDVAKETGKTVPQIALNWLLQRPTVSNGDHRRARRRAAARTISALWAGALTPEQVARLDAASAVTPAYPYWHQTAVRRAQPQAGLARARQRYVAAA